MSNTDSASSGPERKLIRNSTVEFLMFTAQEGEASIEARYEDETVWLSQKLIAELFGVTVPTVNEHLRNVFSSGELAEPATIRNFRIVQTEGSRQVSREVEHYNLDAIISVGYRVNSIRATQFRLARFVPRNLLRPHAKRSAALIGCRYSIRNARRPTAGRQ